MKLTTRLLNYLHRVFSREPDSFLALRLRYDGSMTWDVSDGLLTTAVTGGPGSDLGVNLADYTISSLVSHLAAQPGYTVEYADGTDRAQRSALILIDGTGNQAASNGDHLLGYTSTLYAYMDACAAELTTAKNQIPEMLNQMQIQTASSEWIDEIGDYYGVKRKAGETDVYYGPRIIVEVLRPRGNNVAIEMAIAEITGQVTTVTDITLYDDNLSPLYNNTISYDGSAQHNAIGNPIYGLFDVELGYDLENGDDMAGYASTVVSLVGTLRDAGTHLRSLSLVGGTVSDSAQGPSSEQLDLEVDADFSDSAAGPSSEQLSPDVGVLLADSAAGPTDDDIEMTVNYAYLHDGIRSYNGDIQYQGGLSLQESI